MIQGHVTKMKVTEQCSFCIKFEVISNSVTLVFVLSIISAFSNMLSTAEICVI